MNTRALALALPCLADVAEQLVVVGGTAHALFPDHPLGRDPGFVPLSTADVDWATPTRLVIRGEATLLDRLRAAGFEERVAGAFDHPKCTYAHPDAGATYLEFIAPLSGSTHDRWGKPKPPAKISGLSAERLRHVDLLLHEPWSSTMETEHGEATFQVVNPVAYLLQKLVVMADRQQDKQAKDLLYVHDTLAMFEEQIEELAIDVTRLAPKLTRKASSAVVSAARKHCFVQTALARGAADIAAHQRHRPPTPELLVSVCRRRLPTLLGGVLPGLAD